ncbi:hypothetical protein [Xylella fastidiosa]|uniref:hypothetical protein n=1 Tax=Xylella fastidiosa TaxID=2371 RepID=UPI0003FDCE45|nr:hypothetical protein [Xylella fastidiosa]MCP8325518.1 hypothetical protein [Xylella fastidiosa subsp. multiplex]MDC6413783.1 hypothetical protein [Xylella fastidiosa subsp. multiplex]MDC7970553.1 hypothetical protein [Xylella fastidiosa subsp. multiplex]MDD0862983.1 hypothetical protein [Xylella fastidiosa subsp. multiplex]MDD0879145.1 hypothetical protein [Xylella fastidiosa subsp. multiplex]
MEGVGFITQSVVVFGREVWMSSRFVIGGSRFGTRCGSCGCLLSDGDVMGLKCGIGVGVGVGVFGVFLFG